LALIRADGLNLEAQRVVALLPGAVEGEGERLVGLPDELLADQGVVVRLEDQLAAVQVELVVHVLLDGHEVDAQLVLAGWSAL
jgi:hypothetical protein